MVFYNQTEWHSRQDYYLAQIAAEIRRVRQMFAKNPQAIPVSDCLIKYTDDQPMQQSEPRTQRSESVVSKPKDEIEIGPDAMKDPKWSKVTENAKLLWAARFGLSSFEDIKVATNDPSGT
jgi:hypothetical protein